MPIATPIITERQQVEESLRELNQTLERRVAQRTEASGHIGTLARHRGARPVFRHYVVHLTNWGRGPPVIAEEDLNIRFPGARALSNRLVASAGRVPSAPSHQEI